MNTQSTFFQSDIDWGDRFDIGKQTGSGGGSDLTKSIGPGAAFLASRVAKMFGEDKNKYRNQADLPRSLGGSKNYFGSGSFGKIGEDITMYVPERTPQHDPVYIPGTPGSGKGTGQRISGALSGAGQGFMAGAATGMPHMAGIGAVTGLIGGLFG
jgi:hypothetical protein